MTRVTPKENSEKFELICVRLIYTHQDFVLQSSSYEHPFLGRRHTLRKLVQLGPMGPYWHIYRAKIS